MVKKLHISPSIISRIKPVHSGFALSPSNSEAREKILKAKNGLFLSGAKLEPATNWVSVLVPTVPAFIQMEQGQVEVRKSMLSDEIERFCSVRPAYIKLFGQNNPKAPHRTWMAYFCKAPRSDFRVFDESGIMRPYKKQQPIEFCKRCNGHHPSKNCSRAPSCGNCGSTNHNVDICKAATKCRNCGGPHRADSRRCLARPTRSGAPSKEQLKVYRQAGEREYQAVLRVRAAEEKAMITEKIIIDSTNSNLPEADSSSDIIQVTPDEVSTGGGGATQDIALSRACELRIDVLLMQEPWWSELTKTNPFYDLYLPLGENNVRPRAVTYVRKDPNRLTSKQWYPQSPTSDYCWVEVNDVMFLNVYKAPHDPSAVQHILSWTPTPKSIAIGDFNPVYWAWQPSANSYYGQGEEIERLAEENNLTCLIVGEPTHRAGNTLDLAFTNVSDTMAWPLRLQSPLQKESTGKEGQKT
ncbi:putative eka-like protein [Erysiphe necator]|uniref:Putative eka-like protein n=1 Tax=Uncinula necator TaxID=52586 RepID=A0A0B1PEQ9_UNCNE|nr:putative eka-like protein [Erysiphe necator]